MVKEATTAMRAVQVAIGILGAAVLTACGSSSASVPGPQSTGAHSARPSATVVGTPSSLTPSVPTDFRTGVNHCGDPYGLNATTVRGTIPLLDCPGFAGLRPTPALTIDPGGQILISGLSAGETVGTQSPAVRSLPDGTFVAVQPGRAVLTVHNYPCLPAPGGSQPTSCPLLVILVH